MVPVPFAIQDDNGVLLQFTKTLFLVVLLEAQPGSYTMYYVRYKHDRLIIATSRITVASCFTEAND